MRWGTNRRARLGHVESIDPIGWGELADFGLFHGTLDGFRDIDIAVGMLAAGTGGLPGPVLEAELACAAGCAVAADALRDGRVVTSLLPSGTAEPVMVGWGSVADLTVDQSTGVVLAEGGLPPADTALAMGHGWFAPSPGPVVDRLRTRRWLLGGALLVGLGKGALEVATEHAQAREQFGRRLASFQAVQFRLAETSLRLEAAELTVVDAARRSDADDPLRDVAAAMAWLNATRAASATEKDVHQVLGAIGFTEELGVIRLTYQMAWLRTSIGRRAALDCILDNREQGPTPPHSVVLGAFTEGFMGTESTATESRVSPDTESASLASGGAE